MYRLRQNITCDEETVTALENEKQFSAQDILQLLQEIDELSNLDICVSVLGIEQAEFIIENMSYLVTHEHCQ